MLWRAEGLAISRSPGVRPSMCLSGRSTCEKVWGFHLHVPSWNSWHQTTILITPHTSLTSAWRSFSFPTARYKARRGMWKFSQLSAKILRYVYARSCVCMGASFFSLWALYLGKQNDRNHSQLSYRSYRKTYEYSMQCNRLKFIKLVVIENLRL